MIEPGFIQDARRYLAMLQKRRAVVVTCLGVSLLFSVIYNYTTRPIYQATTQILIDRATPKVLPTKDLVDPGVQDFQTEYELLRGRTLAEKTVESLQLQRSAELATGPLMSPWERFQRKFLGKAPQPTVDADGMPLSPAAAALRSRLRIEPLPGGRLVNLRFNAYDPGLAAQVANTLAELYIEQSLDFRNLSSSEATGWLSDRQRDRRSPSCRPNTAGSGTRWARSTRTWSGCAGTSRPRRTSSRRSCGTPCGRSRAMPRPRAPGNPASRPAWCRRAPRAWRSGARPSSTTRSAARSRRTSSSSRA